MTAPRDVNPRAVDTALCIFAAAIVAAIVLVAAIAMWGGLPSQQPAEPTYVPATVAPAVVYEEEADG